MSTNNRIVTVTKLPDSTRAKNDIHSMHAISFRNQRNMAHK